MKEFQITKSFFKVADFVTWMKSGQLDLRPQFQRRSVWRPGAKSYLIDTIYRGFPIPIIFIRDRVDTNTFATTREIVDGQQRIRTILCYIDPALFSDYEPERDIKEVSSAHNSDIGGKKFGQLDVEEKKKILNYEFSVHVLSSSIDDREIVQIFRRMNSTTYKLNKQELRNAEYFGPYKESVYSLAEEQLNRWRKWKLFTNEDVARMNEVEYTSEIVNYLLDRKLQSKSQAAIENKYKTFNIKYDMQKTIEVAFRNLMEFVEYLRDDIPNSKNFLKKGTFYSYACAMYKLIVDGHVTNKNLGYAISPSIRDNLAKHIDAFARKEVNKSIFDATQRRTTNIKERSIIFNFLLGNG